MWNLLEKIIRCFDLTTNIVTIKIMNTCKILTKFIWCKSIILFLVILNTKWLHVLFRMIGFLFMHMTHHNVHDELPLLYYTINNCYLRYVRFTRSILQNLLILIENLMWLAVKIDISIFYKSILYIETDTCVIL